MDYWQWDQAKNDGLKAERGVSFEQVVMHLEGGDLLDVLEHPNREKYPNQRVLVVRMEGYVYLVPFVESADGLFLKTIIPSRKATRQYLGENGEKERDG